MARFGWRRTLVGAAAGVVLVGALMGVASRQGCGCVREQTSGSLAVSSGRTVSVIEARLAIRDASTGTLEGEATLGKTNPPSGYSPASVELAAGRVWVGQRGGLRSFSLSADLLGATRLFRDGSLRLSTTLGQIWAIRVNDGVALRIDAQDPAVVSRFRVSRGTIAIAADLGRVWIASRALGVAGAKAEARGSVTELDARTGATIAVWSLPDRPLAIDAREGHAWVLGSRGTLFSLGVSGVRIHDVGKASRGATAIAVADRHVALLKPEQGEVVWIPLTRGSSMTLGVSGATGDLEFAAGNLWTIKDAAAYRVGSEPR